MQKRGGMIWRIYGVAYKENLLSQVIGKSSFQRDFADTVEIFMTPVTNAKIISSHFTSM